RAYGDNADDDSYGYNRDYAYNGDRGRNSAAYGNRTNGDFNYNDPYGTSRRTGDDATYGYNDPSGYNDTGRAADGRYRDVMDNGYGPGDDASTGYAQGNWRGRQYEGNARRDDSVGRDLSGEIVSTQTTDYFGNRHTIAKIRSDSGREYVVDLGPEDRLTDLKLKTGERVSVNGRRGMLTAGQVSANDQTVTIDDRWERGPRNPRTERLRGQIDMVQTRSIDGNDHMIAYVDSDNGSGLERVDLGPADQFEGRDFEAGDEIEVEGQPGRGDLSHYFVAQRMRRRSQDIATDNTQSMRGGATNAARTDRNRTMTDEQSSAATPGMSVYSGHIVKQRASDVDGEAHTLATVRLYDGRQYEVDLGQTSRLGTTGPADGDEVQFQAVRGDVGGAQGLRASRVKIGDGDWTQVAQAGGNPR
ncbi:MAG TPA: hypothetical protein P5572_06695, partial [Phycisphaerae bacterium]|nr:hypothetical protein [Phycisphaerae bacterium]